MAKVQITDTILRDAHQSQAATRMRLSDMLPAGEILDSITSHSLVLLDESLSSTGSYEGAYIASEVLQGFSMVKCRGIFTTPLHDLAASVDRINDACLPKGGVKIDNLVAAIQEGSRSFKIRRAKPDGKSYARDIAESYGLTYETILKRFE